MVVYKKFVKKPNVILSLSKDAVIYKKFFIVKKTLLFFVLSDNTPVLFLYLYPLAQRTGRTFFKQRYFLY